MGRSKLMKRIVFRSFGSLLDDMTLEVLARVAASSFDDFVNVKLSSKVLNELANTDYVLQRVSLQKFPVIPWPKNEEAAIFVTRCKNSGNPEALYRQGVIDFFGGMKLDSSVKDLTAAAKSNHMESLYALGIVLMFCTGDNVKQKGIDTLRRMIRSNTLRSRIRVSRQKLTAILENLWIENTFISKQKVLCCEKQHKHGWDREYETNCEACMIDFEIASIHELLPQVPT